MGVAQAIFLCGSRARELAEACDRAEVRPRSTVAAPRYARKGQSRLVRGVSSLRGARKLWRSLARAQLSFGRRLAWHRFLDESCGAESCLRRADGLHERKPAVQRTEPGDVTTGFNCAERLVCARAQSVPRLKPPTQAQQPTRCTCTLYVPSFRSRSRPLRASTQPLKLSRPAYKQLPWFDTSGSSDIRCKKQTPPSSFTRLFEVAIVSM